MQDYNLQPALLCVLSAIADLQLARKIVCFSTSFYQFINSEETLSQLCRIFCCPRGVATFKDFQFQLCPGDLPLPFAPTKKYWKYLVREEQYPLLENIDELSYIRYAQSTKMIRFFFHLFPRCKSAPRMLHKKVKLKCLKKGIFDVDLYKEFSRALPNDGIYFSAKGDYEYHFSFHLRTMLKDSQACDVIVYNNLKEKAFALTDPHYLLSKERKSVLQQVPRPVIVRNIFLNHQTRTLIELIEGGYFTVAR